MVASCRTEPALGRLAALSLGSHRLPLREAPPSRRGRGSPRGQVVVGWLPGPPLFSPSGSRVFLWFCL